jgi:hypothetical protein
MRTAGKIEEIDVTRTCCSLAGESDNYPQDYQSYDQVSLEAVLESVFEETNDLVVY